jgi:hypothetical protein
MPTRAANGGANGGCCSTGVFDMGDSVYHPSHDALMILQKQPPGPPMTLGNMRELGAPFGVLSGFIAWFLRLCPLLFLTLA